MTPFVHSTPPRTVTSTEDSQEHQILENYLCVSTCVCVYVHVCEHVSILVLT